MSETKTVTKAIEHETPESKSAPCSSHCYPTIFRGVFWDAGWEFDGPCVIYEPFKRYGFGGNSGKFDQMVEDICIDIAIGSANVETWKRWSSHDAKEFAWRGWNADKFPTQKGWHVSVEVEWSTNDLGETEFELNNPKRS